MEDVLSQLVKEATGPKLINLKNASQNALDKLNRQHGTHRDASYELRSVCFTAIQMALETKRLKFIHVALNGMHRIIKDERFSSGIEPEDDSLWLPAQLLRTTSSVLIQGSSAGEEVLVNIFRLFLAMSCSSSCTLNGRLLIEILSKCGECWESGSRAVRAASLAAASQCLRTFCAFLKDEAEDVMRSVPAGLMSAAQASAQASAVYNEVIPVMQWLCSRLIEPKMGTPKKSESSGSLYLTECILTLTTALPRDVQTNPHFTAFLWQKFCPTLAAALGSPGRINLDKKFTYNYKDALHIIENEARGFFTGPGLEAPQARCIYLTAIQLLRIAGAQNSLRPMLEALFHRMLLLPPAQNRAEPLKCVKDIFRSPARLVDLSVILYFDKNQGYGCGDDMALFRLIIDAMEECALTSQIGHSCESSLQASVECIVALLESLQKMCSGDIDENALSDQAVQILNNRFSTLKDADYTGPLTYQYMARLPAPYRDAVVELRENGFETSSGSDSELDGNDGEIASMGSGDTEGPEEVCHSSSDDSSSKNESNWPYSYLEAPSIMVGSNGEFDRKHARDFIKSMTNNLVPKLLKMRSTIEVDGTIQDFASNICQENSMNFSDFDYNLTVINADGIYLATYSALLLSFQLMKAGHYDNLEDNIFIPLSEQQFVTSVQNTGVLVYLSTGWLCELYQCIIATNPMQPLKSEEYMENRCALIELLKDAAGIGTTQMMSEWIRLQQVGNFRTEPSSPRRDAANKLARRLLTCCWESIITVLSVALGDLTASTKNRLVSAVSQKTLKFKKLQNDSGEGLFALSLEGLHAAATLSGNSLNLQHLSGKILSLLANNVCQTSGPRITASQALSMNVVLTGGLELGSHSSDCWMPIFSVCRHVTQIEHDLFSLQNTTLSPSKSNGKFNDNNEKSVISPGTGSDKLNLSSCPIDDDETCIDVYSFLQTPLQNPSTNVATILKSRATSNENLLSEADTAKVLSRLSHEAENLFGDASERLSLPALLQFLKNLCRASRDQLYRNNSSKKVNRVWWPARAWKQKNDSMPLALLLHRVGDVTLRVFRSSRPLLHILKVWAITGPHLMDAACHKDRCISKRAIEYIQDIITSLLVEQTELPHFHFNEALLKPFENLLSMETCDIDVQDQIVACLYEIVEAHRTEIRSGWRPLFGTLRNARNRPLNTTNIIDIFRVFLESDNTLVFANAGLDCILCLLSYLDTTSSANNGSPNNFETTFRPIEFLHEILIFIERCASILSFMYDMPKCPNFHSTHKIKGIAYTHIIDANIPNSMENFTYFGNDYLQNINEQHMISYRSLHIDNDSLAKIDELDKASGVLKVWFLLLDGLTNALIVCSIQHQSIILQCILKLFKDLTKRPGIEFGFYCINHLLIPMIQDWLRYVNKTGGNWNILIEKNFKHCCGMTTDLIVDCIELQAKHQFTDHFSQLERIDNSPIRTKVTSIKRASDNLKFLHNQSSSEETNQQANNEQNSKMSAPATLTLKQILLVLIECSAQSQESVARVAISCLKHVILSTGQFFNEIQWLIACSAIHRCCNVTVAPLRQLSFAFHEKSNSFYGDCATVKVAARRDSTIEEIMRINSLAQQVFLMDNQRDPQFKNALGNIIEGKIPSDDRSYSFLLYPLANSFGQNVENFVIRIPYRSLVIGLLANQMLLPLVANLLLGNLKCVPTEVHSCIFDNVTTTYTTNNQFNIGFRSREILLRCVKQYLTSSLEFDSRPGLKFLMQKVSNMDFAANLYKQMTSSWMIYFTSMVDSYLVDIDVYNLSVDDLNYILKSCSRVNMSSIKKKENFVRYLFSLQDAWNLVCEIYLNNSNSRNCDGIEWKCQKSSNKSAFNSDTNANANANDNNNLANDNMNDERNAEANLNLHENNDNNCIFDSTNVESNFAQNDYYGSRLALNQCGGGNNQRTNPFDMIRPMSHETSEMNKTIAPEIEQQRASSILKDLNFKRSVLSQLVIASIELLSSLPKKSADDLRLLMTPTIREAFRLVEMQDNELKLV